MGHHFPRPAACASSQTESQLALQAARVHSGSGDLAAMGPRAGDRGRGPRATSATAGVIFMRKFPGLARPAPRGLCGLARSQAHAPVHSACAARVHDTVHVASELALRSTALCSYFVAPRPGFSPPLHRGMWDHAMAVRRMLLWMRACIRHNCQLGDGGTCAWRLKFERLVTERWWPTAFDSFPPFFRLCSLDLWFAKTRWYTGLHFSTETEGWLYQRYCEWHIKTENPLR